MANQTFEWAAKCYNGHVVKKFDCTYQNELKIEKKL